MLEMLGGQGGASTLHRIVVALGYSGMEMGDDLDGVHHGIMHGNLKT